MIPPVLHTHIQSHITDTTSSWQLKESLTNTLEKIRSYNAATRRRNRSRHDVGLLCYASNKYSDSMVKAPSHSFGCPDETYRAENPFNL